MKPIGTKVLLELKHPEDQKKIGDLILTLNAKKQVPVQGRVLATGNGQKNNPMYVKPGDLVRFHLNVGTYIKYEGKDCMILDIRQIIAVL